MNLGSVTINGFEANARWQVLLGHWLSCRLLAGAGHQQRPRLSRLSQMPVDEARPAGWVTCCPASGRLHAAPVDRQDRIATRFTAATENATAGLP